MMVSVLNFYEHLQCHIFKVKFLKKIWALKYQYFSSQASIASIFKKLEKRIYYKAYIMMLKVYLLICLFPSYILQFCKFDDLPNSIRNLRIKVINFEINTQVIFSNSN